MTRASLDPAMLAALGIDPASEPLAHVELPRRIVPYKRAPKAAHQRPDVLRYHADSPRVARALRLVWRGGHGVFRGRYRLGVLVRVPPCKSGPNKGGVPANSGDHDNYVKAVLDAMAHKQRITAGDDGRYYAGPAPVLVGDDVIASGWQLAETESTVITVWRAYEAQGVPNG